MIIIWILIGFIFGYAISTIISSRKERNRVKKEKESLNIKRGIITIKDSYYTHVIQFEEIERTSTKSKIRITDYKTDQTYGNDIKSRYDGSWVETSKIDWIEKPIDERRDEKLEYLINK